MVCDGFVGNIALKTGEGVAGLLIELLEQAFTKTFYGKCVGFFARPIIGRLLRLMDPSRHNGASLLGLQGEWRPRRIAAFYLVIFLGVEAQQVRK